MRRPPFRHMLLGACLAAPFLLAGCSSEEGVPQSFPPLRYTYLAPLSLNVGSIQTNVAYVPVQDGSSLDSMSPEPPIQAVEQMIQDRLVAGGGGTATITINAASINRVNDTAVGNVSLELQVISADGHRTGFTTASVTRTRTLPDDTSDDAMRAFLYNMTSELVSAENVELEYQIRRHLAAWLLGGTAPVGGPAAPTPVQAQPLGGPGAPVIGTPAPLAAPMPLGAAAPAAATVPPPAPAIPGMPAPVPSVETPTPTMPGGDLGLPQGNPVQQPYPQQTAPAPVPSAAATGAPMPLSPTPSAPGPAYQLVPTQPPAAPTPTPTPAPAPAPTPAPAPAPSSGSSSGSGSLPPLPPSITP